MLYVRQAALHFLQASQERMEAFLKGSKCRGHGRWTTLVRFVHTL